MSTPDKPHQPDKLSREEAERIIRSHLQPGLFLADPANPVECYEPDEAGSPRSPYGIMTTTNKAAVTDQSLWADHGVYLSVWIVDGIPQAAIGVVDEGTDTPVGISPLSSYTSQRIEAVTAERRETLQPINDWIKENSGLLRSTLEQLQEARCTLEEPEGNHDDDKPDNT